MNRPIFEFKGLNHFKQYNRRMWARRLRLPVSLQGVKLYVHQIQSATIVSSILRGSYEADEASSIGGLLKEDDRILELGTGFGFITTLAAQEAKQGNVLSYEANPQMVKLAKSTLQLNKVTNAEVRQGVVAEKEGTMSFFLSPNFWESSLTPNSDWKKVSVPSVELESALSSYQPTAVIIDIEGGEYELLQNKAWDRALSIQKMSIEFHKRPNSILLLKNLIVFSDNWESNIPIEQLSNQLEYKHVTVILRRKPKQL